MEERRDEVHLDEDRARSGSTPHVVRYILGISLVLVVIAMSAIWITGAATQDDQPASNVEAAAEAE
jgi:hypothetical protein